MILILTITAALLSITFHDRVLCPIVGVWCHVGNVSTEKAHLTTCINSSEIDMLESRSQVAVNRNNKTTPVDKADFVFVSFDEFDVIGSLDSNVNVLLYSRSNSVRQLLSSIVPLQIWYTSLGTERTHVITTMYTQASDADDMWKTSNSADTQQAASSGTFCRINGALPNLTQIIHTLSTIRKFVARPIRPTKLPLGVTVEGVRMSDFGILMDFCLRIRFDSINSSCNICPLRVPVKGYVGFRIDVSNNSNNNNNIVYLPSGSNEGDIFITHDKLEKSSLQNLVKSIAIRYDRVIGRSVITVYGPNSNV